MCLLRDSHVTRNVSLIRFCVCEIMLQKSMHWTLASLMISHIPTTTKTFPPHLLTWQQIYTPITALLTNYIHTTSYAQHMWTVYREARFNAAYHKFIQFICVVLCILRWSMICRWHQTYTYDYYTLCKWAVNMQL